MGGSKRRRQNKKGSSGNIDANCRVAMCTSRGDDTTEQNEGVDARIESTNDAGESHVHDASTRLPAVWSVNFVESIEKKSPKNGLNSDDMNIPSVMDVGLQLVRGTLERISNRKNKKNKRNAAAGSSSSSSEISVKPTPIQLRLWPALIGSFESKYGADSSAALNVFGIAPTGSGKTMSYAIPIISCCVRTLLCQTQSAKSKQSCHVHGLVLVPTRELAIQVSKEFKVAAKVANKYLSKFITATKLSGGSLKVESISVYGGVDIEEQISTLLGEGESAAYQTSLVVAATAGRLLDILKQSDSGRKSVSPAFTSLKAIVFDEADRIAVNADMAGQVDEILSILKSTRENDLGSKKDNADIVSCLVSATLPEKAKEMCEKWVPRSRLVVKIDSVKVGKEQPSTQLKTAAAASEDDGDTDNEGSKKEDSANDPENNNEQGKKRNAPQNLDLASIPSHLVQTLHVCSSHKKPRKLIVTLQRIYQNNKAQHGRFSANNRLTIVFFSQIKTVKYASKLLVKEGLRCVELYGSLNQTEREKRLLEFKAGKTPILLATDIAARGLHILNVHFVVNYDFPGSLDQYVHRCGRAGRKQALSGEAAQYPPTVYSFFTREFNAMADSVVELLQATKAWVDPNLLALTKKTFASAENSNKSGRKRRRKNKAAASEDAESAKEESAKEEDGESDNDQFAFLGKSVLKRASHVSDAEDSDDDSS